METKEHTLNRLPMLKNECSFEGYIAITLMKETAKIRRLITKLEEGGILQRLAFNEIPPRVEYKLTSKGQELVESIINLLQWMRKWSKSK